MAIKTRVLSDLYLKSPDQRLVESFQWAKDQALDYAFSGDPVGDWYEAALPGRQAFCMRDVSHQAMGAQMLGLARFTRNMLIKFAENISDSKDWCSYWEIDRRNLPCPADFRDGSHFWYNLPANFDIIHCCWRQYLWTGDPIYLNHPALRYFYNKSVNEYVRRWDLDGDGLLEHYPEYGNRGIATYNEEVRHPYIGGDQLTAQYAGYLAYASFMQIDGNQVEAHTFNEKAQRLKNLYNHDWWNEAACRYNSFCNQDGTFCHHFHGTANFFGLYFDLTERGRKTQLVLEDLINQSPQRNIEERSYLPEIFYRYGKWQEAYDELMALCDPEMKRREYPENSYAAIGAIAMGMMGITPDARERVISTYPRLVEENEWVELGNVPVFDTAITLRQNGNKSTTLTNLGGPALYWRAAFREKSESLIVDGAAWSSQPEMDRFGNAVSSVLLRVESGECLTVKLPR